MTVHIEFEPIGRRGDCPSDSSLLECARYLGVDIVSICGGVGDCGRCIVQILKGKVSPLTDNERQLLDKAMIAKGYRLACRTIPLGDILVKVPPQSLSTPQRTQVEGEEITVKPASSVTVCPVSLKPATLADLQADAERLRESPDIKNKVKISNFDIAILREISPELRLKKWQIQAAVRDGEVVALLPLNRNPLGLAVDLGTSKIAVYLMDLTSGKTLALRGLMNPQISYGEDIIARMALANRGTEQAKLLQELVVAAINEAIIEMCNETKKSPSDIADAVLVANTAMHHLFLRLPIGQLARAPYIATVSSAIDVKARDIGLKIASGAYMHFLPNIAGYVGADHVAAILSTGIYKEDSITMVLDIGTNTEICLANHRKLTSLSCASGPAFEGAHIKSGMRAADGAIEHVKLVSDKVEYQTIGGVAPVGLCGSAILDTLAQLFLAGIVDASGKIKPHPRVRENNGTREFVLVYGNKQDEARPDITFTQRDIRELQLAKGAIRTGIEVLLESNKLKYRDIDSILIAGAFGSYIDVASAVAIGMLPNLPLERFRQVGNAAGMGAKLALISRHQRAIAQEIGTRVQYIDLSSAPQFSRIFNKAINLG
ncbi:MAG: DUF4445 domain-containing protein [Dehalococcoidales bacterium]|nr:DUF4445 domain-containing protein [Dehalococcoidales bacterium]